VKIVLTCTISFFPGKYVPAVSYTIHTKNPGAKQRINFKGRNIIILISLNVLHRKIVDLRIICLVEYNAFSFLCGVFKIQMRNLQHSFLNTHLCGGLVLVIQITWLNGSVFLFCFNFIICWVGTAVMCVTHVWQVPILNPAEEQAWTGANCNNTGSSC
jgi:hypothetical protein